MVMRKASAPEGQTGTTVGVATTESLMPIGTRTTAIVAITYSGATTTTTSARDFAGAMKTATIAVIDMVVATPTATLPCRITFCRKSSISRLFVDDREGGALTSAHVSGGPSHIESPTAGALI